MVAWSFGWQIEPTHNAFVAMAVAPDPSPSPGYGELTTVYDYNQTAQLLYYMPDTLQHDPYIRDIYDAMAEEIAVLRGTLDVMLNNFFVEETVEWGLRLWEAMAGVAVDPDGVGFTDRIAAVKSRLVIGPRTKSDFLQFLRDFFDGVDGGITENFALYTVDVTVFASKSAAEQAAFEEAFDKALPAHLSVDTYSYGGFVAGVAQAGDSL